MDSHHHASQLEVDVTFLLTIHMTQGLLLVEPLIVSTARLQHGDV